MQLTARDKEILIALTHKVRLFSLEQISRTWWPSSSTDLARNRLAALPHFVNRLKLNAHPELALDSPLFTWWPGEPAPRFGSLSYQLKKRWDKAPQPTTAYIATEKAARHFGGFGGKLRRPLQATHDLHVSHVYLHFLKTNPTLADRWVSEERFASERRREKLPDAVILDAAGNVELVIEFGGAYDTRHVKRVHVDCVTRSLPYELW